MPTIGYDPDFAPISFTAEDGEAEGRAINTLREAAERAGVECRFVPVELLKQDAFLEAGIVDVLAAMALTPERCERFNMSAPYLDTGAVGLTAAGLLDIRDRNAIPLAERNRVRQLVTEQNTDWEALYQEIARINGHPEWVDQIRKVFADRWVAKASPGWYHRDAGGSWQRK